jgi:hypothetical protein
MLGEQFAHAIFSQIDDSGVVFQLVFEDIVGASMGSENTKNSPVVAVCLQSDTLVP